MQSSLHLSLELNGWDRKLASASLKTRRSPFPCGQNKNKIKLFTNTRLFTNPPWICLSNICPFFLWAHVSFLNPQHPLSRSSMQVLNVGVQKPSCICLDHTSSSHHPTALDFECTWKNEQPISYPLFPCFSFFFISTILTLSLFYCKSPNLLSYSHAEATPWTYI